MPKVYPHLSVTLCIRKILAAFKWSRWMIPNAGCPLSLPKCLGAAKSIEPCY
jgi:hypothetical protein